MQTRRWMQAAACGAILAVGGTLRAGEAPADKVGQVIGPAVLRDAAGEAKDWRDCRGPKATVVVFMSFDCPVSASYGQPLAELARAYEGRGVRFLAADCTDEGSDAAAPVKLPFPVLRDPRHAAADAFAARVTPEAFVLDAGLVLRYRGRIDDAYSARLRRNVRVTRADLREALDEVLAGKTVSRPATTAVGCPIVRATPAPRRAAEVTFYRDVLPVLQKNCQSCHRPGEVGPFSLLTYRQAVRWAPDIKDYTLTRRMPPWKPVDGPAFQNERRLSDHDIATLAAWVDGGTPEGDPKDAPPPRTFTQGWQLGQPDLVLTASGEFHLGASGADVFRCFVLPTGLPADAYVRAIEVRPGNPRIVHHTLQFIDTSGRARQLEQAAAKRKADAADHGAGYSVGMGIGFVPRGGLGGWAPGQMARELPPDTGYFLPRGADVVLQVHYHRDGRPEQDRTSVGLYLARKPVSRPFKGLVVGGQGPGGMQFFLIPAGDSHYRLRGHLWVDEDCVVHTVMPHMHLLGKEIKVTMTPPGGSARTLVAIREWDYNWQETYVFKEPIPVKAGTRFDIEAVYDNSAANPNNPHSPPLPVTFGQETTNEMCFGFLGVTSNKPGRIRAHATERPRRPERPPADKKAS